MIKEQLNREFLSPYQFLGLKSIKNIINQSQQCTIQPYLGNEHQINLMLRVHNWAKSLNIPTTITYKSDTKSNSSSIYYGDFWSSAGRKIESSIIYLKDTMIPFEYKYIPEYILEGRNRGEVHLLENNFENSFLQQEYLLSIYLENIKNKFTAFPANKRFKFFKDLELIESIYELNGNKNNLPESLLKNHMERFFAKSILSFTQQETENIDHLLQYALNALSSVSGVKFEKNYDNPQVNFFILPRIAPFKTIEPQLDKFHYADGKSIHADLYAFYYFQENNKLMNINYNDILHLVGHIIFDHPNDAIIADRENIFPPDDDFNPRKDYGISNEYRADNGCMSVMAFTSCFYKGKEFKNTLTYMPIDIQVAQYIYGINNKTRSKDSQYILKYNQTIVVDEEIYPLFKEDISPRSLLRDAKGQEFETHSIYTLYDSGGINSFNLSQITSARIDLNEGAGHFNEIGDNIFFIAYNTNIHNVIIGSGDIEIKLNALANNITIPSKSAHVYIENFSDNDQIILTNQAEQSFNLSGCFKPYENIGDNDTEICFASAI